MLEKIKELIMQNKIKTAVLFLAFLMFMFTLFMSGIKITTYVEGAGFVEGKVTLFGVIFGNSSAKYNALGISFDLPFSGGCSAFGIISFILLILGMISLILSYKFEDKKLDLVGYELICASGVSVFFILLGGGANVFYDWGTGYIIESFTEFYSGCYLGAGAFIYGFVLIIISVIANVVKIQELNALKK